MEAARAALDRLGRRGWEIWLVLCLLVSYYASCGAHF